MINAGSNSYISQYPPIGRTIYFQTKTMIPPVIIPAKAPSLLDLLQNKAKIVTGPKLAPNPAQANETILKT